MNCSYREGHILSVLVMMVKFFFYFFLVKFLNKFWEKDYFTEMKASKLFPMLSSWNYRVSNCYELLLQRGPHPVCSRDDGEIFFSFFLVKFLSKFWEKDYFTDMKASKFLAMLSSWNHKDSNCYELLLQRGPHPVCSRDDGEFFFFIFFSLNSWIKFEKRSILPIWKHLNSLQCFPVEITKIAIPMNCSYRGGHILCVLVMMVTFFFYFFLVKFLNKFWEKDYFTEMKASKLFPMLSSWNYRVSNCYELLLQRGPHPVCSRDDGEIFFLFFSC